MESSIEQSIPENEEKKQLAMNHSLGFENYI